MPTVSVNLGIAYEYAGDPPVTVVIAGEIPEHFPAMVTINPTGADNSVLFTAVTPGTTGNAITISYATPAAQATTTVAVLGNAITVTPGTKARMVVTGTLTSDGSASLSLVPIPNTGIAAGKPIYQSTQSVCYWDGVKWILQHYGTGATWHSSNAVATPDLVTTWTAQGASTGDPVLTAGISSASQVISAVNASTPAAALVTAAASGTVTGAVDAVTATNLSGGTGTLPPISVAMAGESITPVAPVAVPMAGDVRSLHLPSFIVLPGVRTGASVAGVVNYDGEVVHYDGEAATV